MVHGLYEFHRHFGRGPVVNPVPESTSRRRALAHVSPIEAPGKFRRGRLRPKVQPRPIRAIPDAQWDELFARIGCNRDRALQACWVSSGARAEELLGVGLGDIDWQAGKPWVVFKGTRLRQAVPVSPEAQAVARAAGQTWLTSAMMTDLADLLTVLDEFLRSSHEVTALLERFLAGRGEHHAGSRASLLTDC